VPKNLKIGSMMGGGALNAATCINHAPEFNVAVAVKEPAVLATWSSTISPSGDVITRCVKPGPGALKVVAVMPAANRSSLVDRIVTDPLLAVVPLPVPDVPISNEFDLLNPEYSVTRKSTKVAGWLNFTVTVLEPALTFGQ